MIQLRQEEREALWKIYPEIRTLFEEYNAILLEDDEAWKHLAENCDRVEVMYHGSDLIKVMLLDLVRQLEQMARKRRGIVYEADKNGMERLQR